MDHVKTDPQVERRTVELTEFRLAPAQADGKRHMVGHAAVFNSLSQDLGGFFEEIRSGAFADAVKHDDIRALFNHDPNYVLGRNTSGTLKLGEDVRGLSIDIDPPDTQWARDLAVSIERHDINQMSFSFQTIDDSWAHDARGTVRTLNKVRLLDVSPVTYPAYLSADIAMRTAHGMAPDGKRAAPTAFEDIRDALEDAIGKNYDTECYVHLVATTGSDVAYEVNSGADAGTYQCTYSIADDGTVTLGEPAEVTVTTTITKKAATGDRSSSTPPEVNQEIPPVDDPASAQERRLRIKRKRLAVSAAD